MPIKRSSAPPGRLCVLTHTSKVLRGNPLGDPHVRSLHVWLPPQYDAPALRPGGAFRCCSISSASPAAASRTPAGRRFDENVPRARGAARRKRRWGR